MDEIRAEREITNKGTHQRTPKEPRLAYEIALGIWIGGVALMVTSGVIGLIMYKLAVEAIRITFG